MSKRLKLLLITLNILSILFLIFSVYFLNQQKSITGRVISNPNPEKSITGKLIENQEQVDEFSNTTKIHWSHMPLTYKFETNCPEKREIEMRKAFEQLKQDTGFLLWFKETKTNPDISIYCKESQWEKWKDETLADALIHLDKSNKNLIIKGEINLYGQQTRLCKTGYPRLEVHEILHLFGFRDVGDMSSVMFSYQLDYQDCKIKKIDKDIEKALKEIYSS